MKVLITGAAGFVGSTIARGLREHIDCVEVIGVDSFIRAGSETNRRELGAAGVALHHGDIRLASDVDALPDVDWVIDAAANPSVLAGVDGKQGSRQVMEHNLGGTINLLEYCRRSNAGFVLLSTSRVYSIPPIAGLEVEDAEGAFRPVTTQNFPDGVSARGIAEACSTAAPVSLYGSTKVASEALALEYGEAFDFPVWINRCGVLAGAGQFGRADQGIFSFWIHAYRSGAPLRYIGFGGAGTQVRDCLHPRDLLCALAKQFAARDGKPHVANFSGGCDNAMSLRQLSDWCSERFGAEREIAADPEARRYDLPWVVLDSALASETWDWRPQTKIGDVLEEIAQHAEANPDWLSLAGA